MANENEERKNEIFLQLIGIIEGMQWNFENSLIYVNDDVKPRKISLHMNVTAMTTQYDDAYLKELICSGKRLCFKISVANENDFLVHEAKRRLLHEG